MCFMTEPEDDLLHVETCSSTDKQNLLSKKLVLGLTAISVVYVVDPNGSSVIKTIEHTFLPTRLLTPPHMKRTIP
jgi:hypothetical protein